MQLESLFGELGVATVSGLIFGWMGYRLGVSAEKRKEYNELADQVFIKVDRKVEASDGHNFDIPRADIKLLRRRMSVIQRRRFDATVAEFDEAARATIQDSNGQVFYTEPSKVSDSLRQIAKILKRK